jgi:hypothetical protein
MIFIPLLLWKWLHIHKLRHVKVLQTVYKCALIVEGAVSILAGNLKPELVTGISNSMNAY